MRRRRDTQDDLTCSSSEIRLSFPSLLFASFPLNPRTHLEEVKMQSWPFLKAQALLSLTGVFGTFSVSPTLLPWQRSYSFLDVALFPVWALSMRKVSLKTLSYVLCSLPSTDVLLISPFPEPPTIFTLRGPHHSF